MIKVKVTAYSISLDGFGAGTDQSFEKPLGLSGETLHKWVFPTRTFQTNVMGNSGGTEGIDNDFSKASFENLYCWNAKSIRLPKFFVHVSH